METPTLRAGPRRVLDGFGRAVVSSCLYEAPRTMEALAAVVARAVSQGVAVAPRGAGKSYGDAALNRGGLVVDTSHLDRIVSWDAQTGIAELEPGVTIEDLWRRILPDGYWPAVVPGTMHPTVAGCAAMNIHGKNHFRVGTFGDHVLSLDLLTMTGETLTCSREENPEVFRAVIGGFGMLGFITRMTLSTKYVGSGDLQVEGTTAPGLEALFDAFDSRLEDADYLVGWIDCFARGRRLGRGVIHRAQNVPLDAHPRGASSLAPEAQDLPPRFFGVIPQRLMWRFLSPWVNDGGMRLINRAKYMSSRLFDRPGRTRLQSHAAFAFLLDYVPRWREAYGPGGFIQVQPFVPAARARSVFAAILTTCQEQGVVPYLGVLKRHHADEFLLSHALDGYSLALDIRVTAKTRNRVWDLGQAIGDLVVDAGGRFYPAKDAVARPDQLLSTLGEEAIASFGALKARLDPQGLLSSELSRRVLPNLMTVTPSEPTR